MTDGAGGVDGLNGAWGVTLSSDGKHAYMTGQIQCGELVHPRCAYGYGGMLKADAGCASDGKARLVQSGMNCPAHLCGEMRARER